MRYLIEVLWIYETAPKTSKTVGLPHEYVSGII